MITSGLVNQRRARFEKGFPHGRSALSSEFIRPHVSGFDMPVLEKSNYASPKTDISLSQTTPLQVNYADIFAKKLTADERLYNNNLLKQIARIARGPEQMNRQMTTPGFAGIGSGGRADTVGPNRAAPVAIADRPRPNDRMDVDSPDTLVKEEGGVVDNPRYSMPGSFPSGPMYTGDAEMNASSVQQIIASSNAIDDVSGDADNLNDELEAQVVSDVVTETPSVYQRLKTAVKEQVYDILAQKLKETLAASNTETPVHDMLAQKLKEALADPDIEMKESPTQGGVIGLPTDEPKSGANSKLLQAKSGASKIGKTFKKASSKGLLKIATDAADSDLLRGLSKIKDSVAGLMDTQEDDWAKPVGSAGKKSEMSVESPVTPVDLRYYVGQDLGPRKRPFVESEVPVGGKGSKRTRLIYDPLNPRGSVDGGEFVPQKSTASFYDTAPNTTQSSVLTPKASEAQVLREIASGELTKKVQRRLSDQGIEAPTNVVDSIVRQVAPSLVIDSKFSSDAVRITHSPISANIPEPEVRKAIISNGVGPRRQSSGTVSIASSSSSDYGPTGATPKVVPPRRISSSSSSDYGPTGATPKVVPPRRISSSSSSDYGPTGSKPKVVIAKKTPVRRSTRKPKK
jgi:hypothetical protein